MKVLFLSISAGQGHHSTALALKNYLENNGAQCLLVDVFEYITPVLKDAVEAGYSFSTKVAPAAYGKIYTILNNKTQNTSNYSLSNLANRALSQKFKHMIAEYKPDFIVCSHVFAAQLVNIMKKYGKINVPILGIITDFTVHPFWQDVTLVDYFVTASELIKYQAVKKGMAEKSILPYGIPIHPKFTIDIDKKEARKAIGIDPDKNTILLMSGSMGYGNMGNILTQLDCLNIDFQTLVVCGNNKKAKLRIDNMKTKKPFYSFGYVDNVDIMMSASDCIITKPGGLTTSEALAKRLPMIIFRPIPGQENRNAEFLLNNGLSMLISSTFPVDEAVFQMFSNPEKLSIVKKSIDIIRKPNATKDVGNFILQFKKDE